VSDATATAIDVIGLRAMRGDIVEIGFDVPYKSAEASVVNRHLDPCPAG
jgi:hypothetical protein